MMMEILAPMKLYINIVFVLCFTAISLAQECKSKIIIQSDSISVNVFINDSLMTDIKNNEIELANGVYKIKLVGDNNLWDTRVMLDSITLKNCETKKIVYDIGDKIYLDSNPQDANVFYGDSLIGHTPVFINYSFDKIILKKSGYADYQIVEPSKSKNIKVNLDFIEVQKSESFFNSAAFKILAGTALALGAVTAYYKLKADNKFDEYKINHKQELLDQTNRYDLVSGITFTALQINLGFLIYKLFTE